jgi:CBS domain-containing protein
MTRNVIAVHPDASARAIAALLLQNAIGAVPVIDETGSPIGVVSEGDLMPRDETESEERRDRWLRILAEGEELSPEFVADFERQDRTARQIMSAPVITVSETAALSEVAEVLLANRIKRAPVLRDGRMVGIVSRADLIKSIANPVDAEPEPGFELFDFLSFSEHGKAPQPHLSEQPHATIAPDEPSAEGFRNLVHRHEDEEVSHHDDVHRLVQEKRHHEVSELLAANLTDAAWARMLHEARLAASKGETQYMLLKFPCELCTDHGRAVNVPDPSWPATLRGIAAQVFVRWKNELRPRSFRLGARVIDFPGGLPGDIGLFLVWGD